MQYRSIARMAVYTIITLGIYQLVWLYQTKQELVAKGYKVPPFKLLFAPWFVFLGIAVAQFGIHWLMLSDGTDATSLSNILNVISVIVGVIAFVALIPVLIYWYWRYCEAVDGVTNKEMPLGLSLGTFILFNFFSVGFVWPFIIQNSFNHLGDSGAGNPQSTPNPPTNPMPPTLQ